MLRKLILLLLCFLFNSSLCVAYEDNIKSVLSIPFGEICTIKAKFVDKPKTYAAQNLSKVEYFLKIIEINDQKVDEPIIVEPFMIPVEVQKNKVYEFKAYETIESDSSPAGWQEDEWWKQFNYRIIHRVVIKPLLGKRTEGKK